MGLLDALAQWQGEAPPGVGRAVEQTPSGPTIAEAWNGPFVDPLPPAPGSPVEEPPAPEAANPHPPANYGPTPPGGGFMRKALDDVRRKWSGGDRGV